jgi:vacuolar protein sorting-associated protein 29
MMQAFKYEDRFLINPGSATGAFSGMSDSAKPSFVLMDIGGSKVGV